MRIHRLAFWAYGIARGVIRATGLAGPMRQLLGPLAGRLIFRSMPDLGLPRTIHGHRMLLASKNSYPPIDMALDRYETETTRLFESLIKPGMVIVDVGAHVGYYSLLAARLVGPTGKVYSFEPDPDNHSLLLKNIEYNGYHNIRAVNYAISNRLGSATLYNTALDSGRHSIYQHGLPQRGTVTVDTTPMDTFLEGEGWPRIGLVKIDVEGAELDVLMGMEQLIGRSPEINLIVEFNPRLLEDAGVNPSEFLDIPRAWSFTTYCIDEKRGAAPLEAIDVAALTNRLLASGDSINLLCSKH